MSIKIGFVDFFLDEWHANQYPQWIREVSGGTQEVRYAYALIDSPTGRTSAQWCKDMGVEQCLSIEALIEKSDVLCVLAPDHVEQHEGLCQLPLRSGKPTYVDKTFAPDGDTATRLFAIAEASGTPCYSASALRFAEEFHGLEGVTHLVSTGPNGLATYGIHQIEPIMMLMGAEAQRVMVLTGPRYESAEILFSGGRKANIACHADGSPFAMQVAAASGNRMLQVESDFFAAFTQALCRFYSTGHVPVAHKDTIAIMQLRGVLMQAAKTPGVWVDIA